MRLISLKDLEKKRNSQMDWFKENNPSSLPDPLFDEEGVFSNGNWNCGEATYIRQYINDLDYNASNVKEYEMKSQNGHELFGEVIVVMSYFEDMTYVQITTRDNVETDDLDWYDNTIINQYFIQIYKSRGAIERFLHNGNPITRIEYLMLLNKIKATGYKF